jgi:hypothetical protein
VAVLVGREQELGPVAPNRCASTCPSGLRTSRVACTASGTSRPGAWCLIKPGATSHLGSVRRLNEPRSSCLPTMHAFSPMPCVSRLTRSGEHKTALATSNASDATTQLPRCRHAPTKTNGRRCASGLVVVREHVYVLGAQGSTGRRRTEQPWSGISLCSHKYEVGSTRRRNSTSLIANPEGLAGFRTSRNSRSLTGTARQFRATHAPRRGSRAGDRLPGARIVSRVHWNRRYGPI